MEMQSLREIIYKQNINYTKQANRFRRFGDLFDNAPPEEVQFDTAPFLSEMINTEQNVMMANESI